MTYNPNHLSNANAQAAASMLSVGIGNVGGKAITSSAQAIQDNFMAEFRKDDDKPKGLGVPDTKKVKPDEDERNLDQKIYDFLVGAGADMEVKEEEPMYMMDFYGGPMFVVPEPILVQQQVLEDPFSAYNVETYNFGGYNDTRDTAPSIGQTSDPDMQDPRRGLMASPTMNQPTTPEALTYVNRAMAKASAVPTKSYTVKDGDTLSQIAEDNNTTVEAIMETNYQIDDKDVIDAGARIEIPLSDTQAALRGGLDKDKDMNGVQTAMSIVPSSIISDAIESTTLENRLFNAVVGGESEDFDTVYAAAKVKPSKPITKMTVGEVMEWQKANIKAGSKSTAAGRFQIISPTLKGLVKNKAIKEDDIFDESTQTKAYESLLDGRGYSKFKNKMKVAITEPEKQKIAEDFLEELAKEFASIPVPKDMTIKRKGKTVKLKKGDSYYTGVAGNTTKHNQLSADDYLEILKEFNTDPTSLKPKQRPAGLMDRYTIPRPQLRPENL